MSEELSRNISAERCLIVNADDFGQTLGITQGIIECHQRGIVTSTSLMVTGCALDQAVALAAENPRLSIGLHFDVWGEDERDWDTSDISATRDEFYRQLERFLRVMKRPPTHVDSHRHVHREEQLFPHFCEWVRPLGVPLRGDGKVNFIGGFYAQWEWQMTQLEYVSVPFLSRMIHEEVPYGYTEISCHPGRITSDYRGVYSREREVEIATLTDLRICEHIRREGVKLMNYADYVGEQACR